MAVASIETNTDPPARVRIALELWGSDLAAVAATCRLAEREGLDAVYYGESPGPLNLDCWTTLAHVAALTTTIRLGPVIANVLPAYRSTLLLAKQAATVAVASGGRLDFRTGVGAAAPYGRRWWNPHAIDYGPYADRLAHLEAFLGAATALWAGPDGSLGALGLAHPPIPVTIAATGPRGIEVAHRWADWWELSHQTAQSMTEMRTDHRCDADRCGLRLSLEVDGFVAPTAGDHGRLLHRVRADRVGEDVDGLVERALSGTPTTVAGQIARLGAAGVDQLVVALHDPHDPAAVTALAEAVRLALDGSEAAPTSLDGAETARRGLGRTDR
ncbi:MAG: LLM class flavin-dependent oxidoreductase [Acidimicrobiales bacterium]